MAHKETDQNSPVEDLSLKKGGFSKVVNLLMEHGTILTVLVIAVGVGCGIAGLRLLPKIQQAREEARREQAKENLKALGEALHRFEEQQATPPPQNAPRPADGQPGGGPSP